jgi:Fe-S oxidoreductase
LTAAAFTAAHVNARILDAGCCGMAGSFGFDKHHYKVSLDVGERVLLPAVRQASADTLIVANGFSCREQIRHGTGRRAYHFAEVVSRAIGATP